MSFDDINMQCLLSYHFHYAMVDNRRAGRMLPIYITRLMKELTCSSQFLQIKKQDCGSLWGVAMVGVDEPRS